MPRRLPRACRYPLCPNLTQGRYCTEHVDIEEQHAATRDSVRPLHERDRTFYKSREWNLLRARVLKYSPMCVQCGKQAEVVDHIIPISQGGERLSPLNLQPLCSACHNSKR